MTKAASTIFWFEQDLRLADNPGLKAAIAEAGEAGVATVFILDDTGRGMRPLGGAARWWLSRSLRALSADLASRGGRLVLRRGEPGAVIETLLAATGARRVFWNRRYDPLSIARDKRLKARLAELGIEAKSFNSHLLAEPWTLKTKADGPFRVYTPFWKALRATVDPRPVGAAPARIVRPGRVPESDNLDDWALAPRTPDWSAGLAAVWTPGEAGAHGRLDRFLAEAVARYGSRRNEPGAEATSRLSPHLRFGEIDPGRIWRRVHELTASGALAGHEGDAEHYLKELAWREFSYHLLYHFPDMPERPLDLRFEGFAWNDDRAGFEAWSRGLTGYPIVDAGMRQLWQTGWMHNRLRMIAASFLVKDLAVHWGEGERWFWDTLVDADPANNPAGWQWVAGCGADAAPYFRIFNPVLQGERFDPEGAYVRSFVPELSRLPSAFVHRPWEAPSAVLDQAGVRLGRDYPHPIVDHAAARERALLAFERIKTQGETFARSQSLPPPAKRRA